MKVKNLYWDEIELFEETTPSWFREEAVTAVPSLEDLQAAVAATFDAFEAYDADKKASRDTTESHAAYMSAIEHQCDLSNRRFVAALQEAPICPSI